MSDRKHEPLSDEHRPVPAKKDVRKWCGGHEGRDHQWAWVIDDRLGLKEWYTQVCRVCEKRLQICPPNGFRGKRPCACSHHPEAKW